MESGRPAIVDIYEQWADKAQDGRTGQGIKKVVAHWVYVVQ